MTNTWTLKARNALVAVLVTLMVSVLGAVAFDAASSAMMSGASDCTSLEYCADDADAVESANPGGGYTTRDQQPGLQRGGGHPSVGLYGGNRGTVISSYGVFRFAGHW